MRNRAEIYKTRVNVFASALDYNQEKLKHASFDSSALLDSERELDTNAIQEKVLRLQNERSELLLLQSRSRENPVFIGRYNDLAHVFSRLCGNVKYKQYVSFYVFDDVLYGIGGPYTDEQFCLLIREEADKERRLFERLKKVHSDDLVLTPHRRESIPESVRIAVWRRDQGHCSRCASRDRLEYDHIIPISQGGSNTVRNIELLCEACNRAKGDKIKPNEPMHLTPMPSALLARRLRSSLWCQKQVGASDRGR